MPAIAVAAAAPAMAASQVPTGVYGTICRLYYGDGTVNSQTRNIFLGLCRDNTPFSTSLTYYWDFTFSNTSWAMPVLPTGSWFTMTATKLNSTTLRIAVKFSTVPTTGPNACYCGSLQLSWGSGCQTLVPGTIITATAYTPSGTATSVSSLKWQVAQRYSGTGSPSVSHYYISKSGGQTCYPETRYAYFNHSGSTWTQCGDGQNDTSTIYPDGTCRKLTLTTGTQNSIAAVC